MMKLLFLLAAVFAVNAEWNELMENENLWQGDIVLDPDEIEIDMKTVKAYASIKGGRWPNPITYKIESSIASGGRAAIAKGIAEYHKWTCLRFKQDQNARGAHISFYRGGGCSSPVGHRAGRMNRISLASGCWRTGTVMHEIGHTIGLYHEQSRPDRDSHVTIQWNNIQNNMGYNFNKQPASNIDSKGTPYDYRSMMHYWGTAFGGGRVTIKTKDPAMQRVIGQRGGFSEIDKKQINLMYCGGTGGGGVATPPPTPPPTRPPICVDKHKSCPYWKKYCNSNSYVKKNCLKSCGRC